MSKPATDLKAMPAVIHDVSIIDVNYTLGFNMTNSLDEAQKNLLLSAYTDSQKSIDLIQGRIDKIFQNYFISIGAVFAAYFSKTPKFESELLYLTPVIAGFSFFHILGMHRVSKQLCKNERDIENDILGTGVAVRPASAGYEKFYKKCFPLNFRGLTWILVFVACLLFSLNSNGHFNEWDNFPKNFKSGLLKLECHNVFYNFYSCKTIK